MCVRRSMIKFEGSPDGDVEICGSARKPLDMMLNRQIIKILEDLGVKPEPFLQLQREAVERLRETTTSAINASTFLERNDVAKEAQLPWLIKKLSHIGMDFTQSDFLRNALELAVLVKLRDIKHKARIHVQEGWTLFGKPALRVSI